MRDSSPVSSQAMISRMTDLIAGNVQPETGTDQMWLDEMNQIADEGGFVSVPTDIPDPMTDEEFDWNLADTDVAEKALRPPPHFDWYGRDADMDGIVQEGTPFERASRSNSANVIKRRRRIHRMRLRDMPFPFEPSPPPTNNTPAAAAPPTALNPVPAAIPDKPLTPVPISTPEVKSLLATIGNRINNRRRRFRPAVFNPDAIDGNSDGTVQDGTAFERPATPHVASAVTEAVTAAKPAEWEKPWRGHPQSPRRPRPPERWRPAADWAEAFPEGFFEGPSRRALRSSGARRSIVGAAKEKLKKTPAPEPTTPFVAIGRFDGVRSPRFLGSESKLDAIRGSYRKADLQTISEFVKANAPFGGHRSKHDGPHPAAKTLVEAMHKSADKRFGPLDTLDQMHAALQKAFPNAQIGIGHALDNGTKFEKVAANESFRIEQHDHVKRIIAEFKVDRAEAQKMYEDFTRSYTKSMLALGSNHPEMVKDLTYVGFMGYNPKETILAFVAPDQRTPGKFVMATNPIALMHQGMQDPHPHELSSGDAYLVGIASGAIVPKNVRELGATSISSIVSDSDLDTWVAATMIHEFGHLAGDHIVAQRVVPELGGEANIRKILFGDSVRDHVPPTKISPEAAHVMKTIIKEYRPIAQSPYEVGSMRLARNPEDLKKRLIRMGVTPPPNLEKLSVDQRLEWAKEVLATAITSTIIGEMPGMIKEQGQRTFENPAIRTLGTYGLTNIEEAAAESFLASYLGLKLDDIVDTSKDPFMRARVRQR